ncbi:MAG: fused MFS/spermidine synthase [Burkholderiales bacterium]
MNAAIWLLVIFVEGFASLGIEIIALRRLVPQIGSSITVTAPTIALFLLALAAGYWSGGRIAQDFERRVLRNFLAAALIAGVGLSSVVVEALFGTVQDPWLAYLLLMALVVCPPAWLLAQTVPLLTNILPQRRVGAASGVALTASTAGSVLGAAVLALVVMQRLGVAAAVLLCAATLALVVLAAASRAGQRPLAGIAALVLVGVTAVNLMPRSGTHETAYADYRTVERQTVSLSDGLPGTDRTLIINNQLASQLGGARGADGSVPKRAAYVERLQQVLLQELQLADRRILVLGAGGFTLSLGDASNHYTYVDVDPAIQQIAERDFLGGPIAGEFIAADARGFIRGTDQRFDAVVVDVYSAHAAMPAHLVTLEFWQSLRRPLTDGGTVLANLILDGPLASAFARNLLATIEEALGRCTVDVLHRTRRISNVLVVCRPSGTALPPVQLYTDDLNRVERDRGILGY